VPAFSLATHGEIMRLGNPPCDYPTNKPWLADRW